MRLVKAAYVLATGGKKENVMYGTRVNVNLQTLYLCTTLLQTYGGVDGSIAPRINLGTR